MELGCGISSLLALSLGPLVGRYVATDQEYVRRLFRENLLSNVPVAYRQSGSSGGGKRGGKAGKMKSSTSGAAEKKEDSENVLFMSLDWEVNSPVGLKEVPGAGNGFDLLVSCDCIYNEALVGPFVKTCAEICRLREEGERQTVCVIAQQQRAPEVFETWLREAMREFRVWRVADEVLGEALKLGSGYVVHLMVLKDVVH